jgi:hypothetical protein
VLFFWVFDGRKAWQEIRKGEQMRLPGIFYPVMKFVVPILLVVILIKGAIDGMIPRIRFMKWVDLPGWSKETASAGERILYEFGLAGRHLVEDPKVVTLGDGTTKIESYPYIWGARLEMLAIFILIIVLVSIAWRRHGKRGPEGAEA